LPIFPNSNKGREKSFAKKIGFKVAFFIEIMIGILNGKYIKSITLRIALTNVSVACMLFKARLGFGSNKKLSLIFLLDF
jgi:hypothetical protein